MKLYFENSNGISRQIAECHNENDVIKEIHNFINLCNKNKPKHQQFKIHYVREWTEEGKTWYDVGSHSEFFYVDKELDPNAKFK